MSCAVRIILCTGPQHAAYLYWIWDSKLSCAHTRFWCIWARPKIFCADYVLKFHSRRWWNSIIGLRHAAYLCWIWASNITFPNWRNSSIDPRQVMKFVYCRTNYSVNVPNISPKLVSRQVMKFVYWHYKCSLCWIGLPNLTSASLIISNIGARPTAYLYWYGLETWHEPSNKIRVLPSTCCISVLNMGSKP